MQLAHSWGPHTHPTEHLQDKVSAIVTLWRCHGRLLSHTHQQRPPVLMALEGKKRSVWQRPKPSASIPGWATLKDD